MATVNPVGTWINKGVHKTTWTGITGSGDTVGFQSVSNLPDKTISVRGTFGTVSLEYQGSNDGGTTTFVLEDTASAPIANATAAKVETPLTNPELIRVFPTSGSGGNIIVEMISKANIR